jgi:hypothetical protein
MSQQETATTPLTPKKKVRKEVGDKLAGALAEYKQELGEKTWTTHVKKISKLISRDLLKISKKKEKATKKNSTKKNAAKKDRKKAAKQ